MAVKPYPYPAAAIRQFLIAQPELTTLVPAASVTTGELSAQITGPVVTIAVTGNVGDDPFLRRPMVQVTPWVPKASVLQAMTPPVTLMPDELAWNIGTVIGQLIGRAADIPWRDCAWTARWTDGPVMLRDIKRGVDNPLIYAPVRFELKQRGPR